VDKQTNGEEMKMQSLSDHPLKVAATGLSGLGVSTIESLTVYVQFGVATFSLILLGLTIWLKFRELKRGSAK